MCGGGRGRPTGRRRENVGVRSYGDVDMIKEAYKNNFSPSITFSCVPELLCICCAHPHSFVSATVAAAELFKAPL